MARLLGDIEYTGTIDGLCFYKMYGSCFVRTKSSLTAKRFWNDTAFEGSRKSCNQLAKASAIASMFYKTYPKGKRRKGLFNEMTGKVKLWLKEERTEDEVLRLLQECYPVKQEVIKKEKRMAKKVKAVVVTKKEKLFVVIINEHIISNQRKYKGERPFCLRE